jgi:uncharacterized protein (DUF1015 family)
MADVQPFRAVRYSGAAGPLRDLVAPPYDAISPEQRDELYRRSPYNVVHLTLPESVEQAALRYREWLSSGILVREEEPAVWLLLQRTTGRDRLGIVVSLRAEPYSAGTVLPHERTYPRVRDERLELLRATGAQLEPIFLLVDAPLDVHVPDRDPDALAPFTRLWRLSGFDVALDELLIADGHHRYESALGYGADPRVMALVVSSRDPALEIWPTHRVFRGRSDLAQREGGNGFRNIGAALAALNEESFSHSAVVAYRAGHIELIRGDEGELDVELVDRYGLEGISYASTLKLAQEPVDRGEADVAFITRPPRPEDIFAAARHGRLMPPKSTYFHPKPLSGLLFHPLDT